MKFLAQVHTPMYDHNDKMYIRLVIPEKCAQIVQRMHKKEVRDNPLDGRILTVKVPFRYRRVMCEVQGQPVQALTIGSEVEVEVEFMGVWNVGNYSGFSWKLVSIKS
ncbi:hypothetical protein OtV5_062 [Ostreococcus tauri virus OtV5]|jgi:hypothetical protein|uniref:Uncharacterized protein n=1 Tax=Ostreococcus tauri virus OtV5 TaxID=1785753 RepID=A9YVW4_9PHYC|nr:hypothetical protein OtV5_062 [Ostreococcus tauri virus OtV5]YP_003212886.1 hypothetical protein OTV1_062 [Ostreococcus tauri virus 1]YP_009172830.1 hypothetical protein AP053_gp070 [Ostreococcus mediterraneus virus 1]ABY27847.1 hypothetical protein OtV5_062 [Ostreococcus tauri virus OtV5]ALI95181.1 hypothetical protein OmV1_070 [Ostreococcus mediterraneus virus 1]CAY39650.1 hypothetical protein OTV1_062 [Ostreococcus tauri virus 1]